MGLTSRRGNAGVRSLFTATAWVPASSSTSPRQRARQVVRVAKLNRVWSRICSLIRTCSCRVRRRAVGGGCDPNDRDRWPSTTNSSQCCDFWSSVAARCARKHLQDFTGAPVARADPSVRSGACTRRRQRHLLAKVAPATWRARTVAGSRPSWSPTLSGSTPRRRRRSRNSPSWSKPPGRCRWQGRIQVEDRHVHAVQIKMSTASRPSTSTGGGLTEYLAGGVRKPSVATGAEVEPSIQHAGPTARPRRACAARFRESPQLCRRPAWSTWPRRPGGHAD